MNRLFKYTLVAAITLGVGIEVLKFTSHNDLNQSLEQRFQLNHEKLQAFGQESDPTTAPNKVIHTATPQRRAVRPTKTATKTAKIYNLKMEDFLGKKKSTNKKKVSKKKKKKKVAGKDKKKKENEKKKKAEQKKKAEEIKIAKDKLDADSENNDLDTESDLEAYTNTGLGGENTPQPEETEKEETETLGYDEWARLVLTTPSFNNTSYMIDEFRSQSKTIDAEIFYKIIQEMISDERTKMREYGVLAARLTPSKNSFEALTTVMQNESNGSATRVLAEKAINEVYRQVKHLGVLRSILTTSSSTFAVSIALKTLSAAALALKEPLNSSNQNSAQNADIGANHPYAERFTAFSDILNTLEQTENQQVNNEASATRASLAAILEAA